MDGFTFITIVVTAAAVLGLERLYQQKKASASFPSNSRSRTARYREEAFEEIIKINEDSIQHGSLDSLTGLPGRQIYDERLKKILAHSQRYDQIFSVMVLNIDELTTINRVYGNEFGNKLLVETANRLRTVLRQIDTVSRYAGDSYFFILPELSKPDVTLLVAQRIQDSIIQPFNIEGQRIFVTASIGIAIFSPETDTPESLLKNAEKALNKAKLSGRNTYRIYNEDELKLYEHDPELSEHFSNNEFIEKLVMHYQPYVNAADDRTMIIQAMPYYEHPETGLISYKSFIYAVEENNKMLEMGKWQLKKVWGQLSHWRQNGYLPDQIMLSVTLSQLLNPAYMAAISDLITQDGIESHKIIFDIIEFDIKSNNQAFRASLQSVKNLGIRLSFNLMALGRLALHNILEFPVDYLKIDEKLVKGMILNLDNDAIIASLIAISANANIQVIAEGVDFENQKNKLVELGCMIMKGALYSLPVTANEFFDIEISKIHANKAVI